MEQSEARALAQAAQRDQEEAFRLDIRQRAAGIQMESLRQLLSQNWLTQEALDRYRGWMFPPGPSNPSQQET